MIKYPYAKQWIDESDIEAVSQALRGEYLTGGALVAEFEAEFARKVGARYAVAVSSGTAALHIAYLATGLTAGDSIITTPLTFAATANAALYCGAKPVFVDVDNTGNIDVDLIEAAITSSTRLIAPVHYAGQTCDMGRIHAIAERHNLFVVEDACHALGGKCPEALPRSDVQGNAQAVGTKSAEAVPLGGLGGNCSDMTVFSFHPVKHITTGEGGMVTTNNEALYKRLKLLRSHGIVTSDEHWKKDMQLLGYNYRLTDIQAALGLSQLKRLDMFMRERQRVAATYDKLLANSQTLTPLAVRQGAAHARHLYPVLLNPAIDRDDFIAKALDAGIGLQVHYGLVYKHRYYQRHGYEQLSLPVAEALSAHVLSLPLYPQLTDEDVHEIVTKLSYPPCRG